MQGFNEADLKYSQEEQAATLSEELSTFFSEKNIDPRLALEAMNISSAAVLVLLRKEFGQDLLDEKIEKLRKRVSEMMVLRTQVPG